MISADNKSNDFYWFAVIVPGDAYTEEEGEEVHYWLKTDDTTYADVTENKYAGDVDGYGFLLGAKDDSNEIATDTTVDYTIALAPVRDGNPDPNKKVEFEVSVTFTRPEVTIYEDITVTDRKIANLGLGRKVTAESGDGTQEKPYFINETVSFKKTSATQIDNTYWFAVDVLSGTGTKKIGDLTLGDWFADNVKKDTLFGFGDNGSGDSNVVFALGDVYYKLSATAGVESEDESEETTSLYVAEEESNNDATTPVNQFEEETTEDKDTELPDESTEETPVE